LIFENTDYYIILYPEYDMKKYDFDDLNELKKIFGENKIYDYTGKNNFTKNLKNYVDNIHARSRVGNEILKDIYINKFEQ
jgi:hypothetical protein